MRAKTAAERVREVLTEDGWAQGSLAMGYLDDALEEARAAALASFTDLLDSIDSIVDDTHPEGDGCSLCEALDDMRALLDAETAGADAEGSRES